MFLIYLIKYINVYGNAIFHNLQFILFIGNKRFMMGTDANTPPEIIFFINLYSFQINNIEINSFSVNLFP